MPEVENNSVDIPPTVNKMKQLKQARLPFKVLTKPSNVTAESPVQSSLQPHAQNTLKKRKLSELSPVNIKASKNPRNDEHQSKTGKQGQLKSQTAVDLTENEVSSSSENEPSQAKLVNESLVKQTKEKKIGLMDAFLRTTQQLEVSTTNNVDSNDPTESNLNHKNLEDESNPTIEIIIDDVDGVTETSCKLEKIQESAPENLTTGCDSTNTACGDLEVKESELNVSMNTDAAESSVNDDASVNSPVTPKQKSPSNSKPKSSGKKVEEREAERKKREEKRLAEKEEKRLQKLKEIEEKNRQKQQEKEKREKEKEEAKKKREQEKKEKLEQKEKEKQEKLKQKEEEKKKKEDERLKKLEEKNKELEEKQRLKEEKEAQDKKMEQKELQKQKSFLSNFFTKKEKETLAQNVTTSTNGIFQQFPIKNDMRLAPVNRVDPKTKLKELRKLDELMIKQDREELYLKEIHGPDYKPGTSDKTWPSEDQDLVLVEDEKKPGQKMMKAKYFLFHENYRPPYYGTWRKSSHTIHKRNPFAKDTVLLDYEVDSDDEWEEEEPGESVSDSGGEDDDKVPNDDEDEDDGFFVPHGYLSEDEGCEDDDEDVTPERLKARQLAKAKAFEAEMSAKTQQLRPVVIGCVWTCDGDKSQNMAALEILKKFQVASLLPFPISIATSENADTKKEKSKKDSKSDRKSIQLQAVPEEAMEDLVRLVHGNVSGIKNLIREFREYWRQKEAKNTLPPSNDNKATESEEKQESDKNVEMKCDDTQSIKKASSGETNQSTGPSDSTPKQSVSNDEEIKSYSISKRQLDKTIKDIGTYEKRGSFKHCWYVNNDVLEKYKLTELPVPSEWVWVTKEPLAVTAAKMASSPSDPGVAASEVKSRSPTPTLVVPNKEGNIRKFAKPGISPKFLLPSPKPVIQQPQQIVPGVREISSLSNTTFTSPLNTKNFSCKPKINPSVLFKPVPLSSGISSVDSDCAIVAVEKQPTKSDKNQPTLFSMLTASSASNKSKKISPSKLELTDGSKKGSRINSGKKGVVSADSMPTTTATTEGVNILHKANTLTVRRKADDGFSLGENNGDIKKAKLQKPIVKVEDIIKSLGKDVEKRSASDIAAMICKASEEETKRRLEQEKRETTVKGSGTANEPMEID